MADRDATLRGILEKNKAATGAGTAAYHLNHVTIELDASGVGAIDEGLEGLPVSVEGHFEMREHPESGTRWVFKAIDRKSTRLNSSHRSLSRMPSSA